MGLMRFGNARHLGVAKQSWYQIRIEEEGKRHWKTSATQIVILVIRFSNGITFNGATNYTTSLLSPETLIPFYNVKQTGRVNYTRKHKLARYEFLYSFNCFILLIVLWVVINSSVSISSAVAVIYKSGHCVDPGRCRNTRNSIPRPLILDGGWP